MDTPEGRGTVVEVDLLRQRVKVRMEDAPETISVFANADIAILRSGKAKKNDPPIPADLAPISGAGKKVRKAKLEDEETLLLEPIRFRYSTENVVEEQETPAETTETAEAAEEQKEGKSSRSRRRRKNKGDAPKTEQPEQKAESKKEQPKKEQPKKEQAPKEAAPEKEPAEGEEAAKKPRRRNNYRRHRRPKGNAEG